jgi:hypothetical protein
MLEMQQQIGVLREDMQQQMGDMQQQIGALRGDMQQRFDQIITRLDNMHQHQQQQQLPVQLPPPAAP